MNQVSNKRFTELVLTLPSFIWLILFFLIPTLVVFIFAFKPADIYGNISSGWTLSTFSTIFTKSFFDIVVRTIWISVLSTFLCIALALPTGYYIAIVPQRYRQILILLVVLPFWSSFLIRIFAWKSLLHPEGFLKKTLVTLHLIHPDTSLLYNSATVVLVMVYSYLPFAVLPIYAAASKFNFQLFEAALDLGASRLSAFFKIFIPGIRKGIFTALLIVFIPALGAYVIPDVVGGTQSEMVGNKIAQRAFVERNLPQASAISTLLAVAVLLPLLGVALTQARTRKDQFALRNKL